VLLVRKSEDVDFYRIMYNCICTFSYTVYWSPVGMKCMRDDMSQAGVSGHKTHWEEGNKVT
jgi:hypothetical protein